MFHGTLQCIAALQVYKTALENTRGICTRSRRLWKTLAFPLIYWTRWRRFRLLTSNSFVRCDDDLCFWVVDPGGDGVGRKAGKDNGVNGSWNTPYTKSMSVQHVRSHHNILTFKTFVVTSSQSGSIYLGQLPILEKISTVKTPWWAVAQLIAL